MRRQLTATGLAGLIVAVVLVAILAGGGVLGKSAKATPTPVPTAAPVSTQTTPGHHHAALLTASLRTFVHHVCSALQSGKATPVENSLINYQYDRGVYYSHFDLALGILVGPSVLSPWVSGGVRCVRVAQPYGQHAVVATMGWHQPGGWALLDLDIAPGHSNWGINDFTFGDRKHVLGDFYANYRTSVRYRG